VFGVEVSQIFALVPKCPLDTSALVPKCLGQFGTKVHETLRTQNYNMLECHHCVKKCIADPLSNRVKVFGKRLTKAVSDSVSYV